MIPCPGGTTGGLEGGDSLDAASFRASGHSVSDQSTAHRESVSTLGTVRGKTSASFISALAHTSNRCLICPTVTCVPSSKVMAGRSMLPRFCVIAKTSSGRWSPACSLKHMSIVRKDYVRDKHPLRTAESARFRASWRHSSPHSRWTPRGLPGWTRHATCLTG